MTQASKDRALGQETFSREWDRGRGKRAKDAAPHPNEPQACRNGMCQNPSDWWNHQTHWGFAAPQSRWGHGHYFVG